jgi:hypothetical protein
MRTYDPVQEPAGKLPREFRYFFRKVAESVDEHPVPRQFPGILLGVAEKETNPRVREVAMDIANKFQAGCRMWEAMSQHEDVFDTAIIARMRKAEGRWDSFLDEIRYLGGLDKSKSSSRALGDSGSEELSGLESLQRLARPVEEEEREGSDLAEVPAREPAPGSELEQLQAARAALQSDLQNVEAARKALQSDLQQVQAARKALQSDWQKIQAQRGSNKPSTAPPSNDS